MLSFTDKAKVLFGIIFCLCCFILCLASFGCAVYGKVRQFMHYKLECLLAFWEKCYWNKLGDGEYWLQSAIFYCSLCMCIISMLFIRFIVETL